MTKSEVKQQNLKEDDQNTKESIDQQTDLKIDSKSDSKTDFQIDSKTESKIDSKTDSKIDLKIDLKPDSEIDLKPDLKIDLKTDQKPEVQNESIDHPRMTELRNKVFDYLKENEEVFHPEDIKLLKTSNFWINRFLNFCDQSFESAFDHLVEVFKYRKESGIRSIKKTSFPLECYLSSTAFIYLPDKENCPVLYIRVKKHLIAEDRLRTLFKDYLLFLIDEIDKLSGKEYGYDLFLDLCGMGWKNLDFDILSYLVQVSRYKYPNGCKWCILHGLPWFLNYVIQSIVSALPSDTSKKVKFISGSNYDELPLNAVRSNFSESAEDLNNNQKLAEPIKEDDKKRTKLPVEEFIDRSNLPDFLGGTSNLNYKIAPRNLMSLNKRCSISFNYTEKELEKMNKQFQKVIDDSNKTYKTYKDNKFEFEFDLDDISEAYAKHIKL